MLLRSHLKSSKRILWQTLTLHLWVLTLKLAGVVRQATGRRGYFVLFPRKMRPVCLRCFSLLLFFSAFHQIIAEPVDQFQSSGTEGESCETWSLGRKPVLQYVQGSWQSAFTRESDHNASSWLTSHPLDFAPAAAEAVTCPSGGVQEGSCGIWHLKGMGGPPGTVRSLSGHVQWDIAQEQLVVLCLGRPCNILHMRPKEHTYLGVARLARTDN